MRKLFSTVCASALALSFAAGSITAAGAGPLQMSQTLAQANTGVSSDIQQVGHRRDRDGRRFYRRGGNAYYGGHRGYRNQRRGYRNYNGYWFPPAAFIGGVIIGNSLSNRDRGYRRGDTSPLHIEYCYDRYRSYRASDDTFQPYNGPRRRCNSPYS